MSYEFNNLLTQQNSHITKKVPSFKFGFESKLFIRDRINNVVELLNSWQECFIYLFDIIWYNR